MHSTASDGQFSPAEVVHTALGRGLHAIALTDHDTTNGVTEALVAASQTPLQLIPGIEMGCEDAQRTIDILGYFIDIQNTEFQNHLVELRTFREHRAELIVEKLARLGVNISVDRIRAISEGAAITRPHIARVLVESGIVPDKQTAFDRYLANDGPAYVPRFRLTIPQAIVMIHQAKGVAILAHPGRYASPMKVIDEAIAAGVDGLEVYYPDHAPEFRQQLLKIVQEHNLIATGGSDFHYPENGNIRMGVEAPNMPADVLTNLRQRATRYQV
ncbi:MAG: PHP domain-containing protein [Chloroflexi bacterium]|nr:PHP domain-containing protein [Chloroflexota bacterium]